MRGGSSGRTTTVGLRATRALVLVQRTLQALLVGLCVVSASAGAQPRLDAGAAAPAAPVQPPLLAPPVEPEPPPRGPEDPFSRGTPRGTTRGFLEATRTGDYERAIEFLDLRRVPASRRDDLAPELAKQLRAILDRTLWVNLNDLSDDPEGNTDDGLPPRADRLGSLDTPDGVVDIKLARVPREDGQLIWKVSADTVRQIPALNEEFGLPGYATRLPPVLLETRIFDVALWQWAAFAVLFLGSAALGWIVEFVGRRIVLALSGSARSQVARLLDETVGPLRFLLGLLAFQSGLPLMRAGLRAQRILEACEDTLWVVAGTWVAIRVAEAVAQRIVRRLTERGQLSATALVPVGRRMTRFVIYAIGGLFALHSFGVNVTALVAGLGVGGLAVALAAQKTLENLFGGITVIADAPVRVGDFCRFGDNVGIVEEIGLRSTRIRTLERTVIAVPNAEFSTMQLENYARRDRFLLKTSLGLRYETTPDQLRFVLREIQRLLRENPAVDPDPARVRFVGLGSFSLDIEIFAYVRTSDVGDFHEIREGLLLQIMDVVQAAGTGFAFPSQTAYVARDEGLDPERRRAAEEQVARWREEESETGRS